MSFVEIPKSSATVSVSIIDTTSWAYKIPCANIFKPKFHGLNTFDICSYAFLITHGPAEDRRRVLFDLGIRKDWKNMVPSMVSRIDEWGVQIEVEKDVAEILRENDVEPGSIEGVIWSHTHWDHTGNPSTFPPSVRVIAGPGVSQKFMPGWPTVPEAEFMEADLKGHKIVGLEHDDFNTSVGGFRALDYFGDGSFYILDAPGHLLGHLNALARTSSDADTYIFLAADSIHLGGQLRPSQQVPLPHQVDVPGVQPRPCPVGTLLEMHPRCSSTLPYLGLHPCFPQDLEAAERTIELIQRFYADDKVLVIFSHDVTVHDAVEFFPRTANDWKAKGWMKTVFWEFLSQLQKAHSQCKQSQV